MEYACPPPRSCRIEFYINFAQIGAGLKIPFFRPDRLLKLNKRTRFLIQIIHILETRYSFTLGIVCVTIAAKLNIGGNLKWLIQLAMLASAVAHVSLSAPCPAFLREMASSLSMLMNASSAALALLFALLMPPRTNHRI